MIYVYAIADRTCAPAGDLLGLDDRPIDVRAIAALAAVFSEHAEVSIQPSAERLWRHEAVVESLLGACEAILPVRFGMTLGGVAMIDDVLAQHGPALSAGLDRVRGCVEVGLRVTRRSATPAEEPPPASEAPPRSGREYMQARLDAERRRRGAEDDAARVADAVRAAIAPFARGESRRILPAAGVLLTAAYLVPRDGAQSCIGVIRGLAPHHPDLRLLCTGPWPPYHFAPELSRTAAEAVHG